MKDHPQTPAPPSGNPGDPEATREPSAIPRYGETDWYIFHFVLFTTAGVITMIVYQVINPVGVRFSITVRYSIASLRAPDPGWALHTQRPWPLYRRPSGPSTAACDNYRAGPDERKPRRLTLHRGKGDGAAPWPVRATGPPALPAHRSCRKPSG